MSPPLLALEHLYVSHELRFIHKLLTNGHGYWLVGVFPGRWWGGTVNPSEWQKVPPRGDTVADRGRDSRHHSDHCSDDISVAVRLHSDHDDDITKPEFPPRSTSCKYWMAMVMMHNWNHSIDGKHCHGKCGFRIICSSAWAIFLPKDIHRKLQYAPWIVGHRRWKYQVAEFRFSSKAGAADPRMPFGLWVNMVWSQHRQIAGYFSHAKTESRMIITISSSFPFRLLRAYRPPFQHVSITRGALPTVADYVMRP